MWEYFLTGICSCIVSTVASTVILSYFFKLSVSQQRDVEEEAIEPTIEEGLAKELAAGKTVKILIESNPFDPYPQNTLYRPVIVLSKMNNMPRSIYGTLTIENAPLELLKRKPPFSTRSPKNVIPKKQISEKRSVLDIDFGNTMDENQFASIEEQNGR